MPTVGPAQGTLISTPPRASGHATCAISAPTRASMCTSRTAGCAGLGCNVALRTRFHDKCHPEGGGKRQWHISTVHVCMEYRHAALAVCSDPSFLHVSLVPRTHLSRLDGMRVAGCLRTSHDTTHVPRKHSRSWQTRSRFQLGSELSTVPRSLLFSVAQEQGHPYCHTRSTVSCRTW